MLNVIASIGFAFKIKNAIIFNKFDFNKKFIRNKKLSDDENLKLNSGFITNYNIDIYDYLKLKKNDLIIYILVKILIIFI